MLANHVFMPYNDTLEQCVEGGLIGVLFYMMFYAIMICKSYKRKKYDTLAVALCTLGMSMFNFLYTYPIVWLLLMCNYAEISIDEKKINEESPRPGTFFISGIFSPGGSGPPPEPTWQGRE